MAGAATIPIRYSLSSTRYSLLATRYSLLATRYSLLATRHARMEAVTIFFGILPSRHPHSRLEQFLIAALGVIFAYTVLAYLLLPALWNHHEHQRGLAGLPMVTRTAQGIPGDPINVGLIGDKREVLCAMQAA